MPIDSREQPATSGRRHYGERLRILVVDDDADTVNTLAFILRDEGYVVQGFKRSRASPQ
jgi:response regulator RpfG family c-di-GMP phosphodiesterase